MMKTLSERIELQAKIIAAELKIKPDEVITAWLNDWLHHDMRDSAIRKLNHERERVGLPAPDA